jgi:carboxymethylenebutenolidase
VRATREDQAKTRADFVAAANFLKGLPECSGKIGIVGFC